MSMSPNQMPGSTGPTNADPMTAASQCAVCARPLDTADSDCIHCSNRRNASQLEGWVSRFVQAAGRTRKAGYWLAGGGVAVILSSFMPWVSVDGVDDTHPTGGGLLLLLVIGGLYSYFATRVLQGRFPRRINVILWVLAGIDVLISLGILAGVERASSEGSGLWSVSPSLGFFVGLGGLAAGVVGTAMLQTARGRRTGGSSSGS